MFRKISAFFVLLSVEAVLCRDTGCEDSQKHFANSCFSPSPTKDLDFEWMATNQPADGWFVAATNDLTRLHLTEDLQGKVLTLQDNFDDPCFRAKLINENGTLDVQLYGYDNLTFHWVCAYSKDFRGLYLCDHKIEGPTDFHEDFNVWFTYSDNKNVAVLIYCFPNGQVGWATFSITPTLTEEEMKTVTDQLKQLGFAEDTAVTTFTDSCPNK